MSTEVLLTQLNGRRVVAADDATEIGQVKHLVLTGDATRVEALHISGKKDKADLVSWDDIASIGHDAVMASSAGSVRQPSTDVDSEFVRGDVTIIGARVLDTDGYEIAEVTDLAFDSESGNVIAVSTTTGRIAPARIRSLGTFALVVDPEA